MTLEEFVAGLRAQAAVDAAAPSPYERALLHIELHPGTGSALGLAKLLLSLWNGEDCGFSFRECIGSLDDERRLIALACVTHFAMWGEDRELVTIGHRVHEQYPRLWELCMAAQDAKAHLRRQWDEEARLDEEGR